MHFEKVTQFMTEFISTDVDEVFKIQKTIKSKVNLLWINSKTVERGKGFYWFTIVRFEE